MNKAILRFYEELNDFLPESKKKSDFEISFKKNPSIKHIIESHGVPHSEVDLILVNSISVPFSYKIKNKDRVSIYPKFETLNIETVTKLKKEPLRNTKFILDVHLGKLSHYLRMAGFDTLYRNDYQDDFIVKQAKADNRIILTRDIGLLKRKNVTHGYWLRSQKPKSQLHEVIHYFDLTSGIRPFQRCLNCNGLLQKTDKKNIIPLSYIPIFVKQKFHSFYQCLNCQKIYWPGTHYHNMKKSLENNCNYM